MKRRALWAALVWVAGCNDPPPRPRPVEVPISEYRVGETTRAPESAASPSAPTPSATAAADRDHDSVAAVPEEPREKAEAATVATQLDAKGGFLGATFGSSTRAYRGLVAMDRRGETYRVPAKSYGGIALRDVFYLFHKGKLATIQFSTKSADDCKSLRDMLTRELGAPQRSTPETALWRGERTALRFVIGSSGTCSATVLSKEHARAEFDSL